MFKAAEQVMPKIIATEQTVFEKWLSKYYPSVTGYVSEKYSHNCLITAEFRSPFSDSREIYECRWSKNGSEFKDHFKSDKYVSCQVDMEARKAIEDAINIAIRDKLWEQHDVCPSMKDYGRIQLYISFELPPNKGNFIVFVPVMDAEHLRPFLSKLWLWMQAVKNSARDVIPTAPATKSSAGSF